MSALPFSISSAAAAWILEKLKWAEKEPEFARLLPTLCFVLNYQCMDEQGRVFERYRYPFFDIGWFPPETAATHGLVAMELGAFTVFARPETLKRLEGQQLVLETVEVGFPTPAHKKHQVVRAIPEGKAEGKVGRRKGEGEGKVT